MAQLYLIRHGENVEGKTSPDGPLTDLGLSETGRTQAMALRSRLERTRELKPVILLSSPERRAMETALCIAPALSLAVTPDRDLEEWRSDDGTLDPDAFMAEWRSLSERQRLYHRFMPGCETQLEFSTRVHSALHRIAQQYAGESVVMVTHGGFIQMAYRFFFGFGDAAFRRAYAAAAHTSITCWRQEIAADRWVLQTANDVHHLSTLPAVV